MARRFREVREITEKDIERLRREGQEAERRQRWEQERLQRERQEREVARLRAEEERRRFESLSPEDQTIETLEKKIKDDNRYIDSQRYELKKAQEAVAVYSKYDQNAWGHRTAEEQAKVKSITEDIEKRKQDIAENEIQLAELKIKKMERGVQDQDQNVEDLQSKLNDLYVDIKSQRDRITGMESELSRINHGLNETQDSQARAQLEEQKSNITNSIATATANVNQAITTAKQTYQEFKQAKQNLEANQQELSNMNNQLSCAKLEQIIKQKEAEILKLKSSIGLEYDAARAVKERLAQEESKLRVASLDSLPVSDLTRANVYKMRSELNGRLEAAQETYDQLGKVETSIAEAKWQLDNLRGQSRPLVEYYRGSEGKQEYEKLLNPRKWSFGDIENKCRAEADEKRWEEHEAGRKQRWTTAEEKQLRALGDKIQQYESLQSSLVRDIDRTSAESKRCNDELTVLNIQKNSFFAPRNIEQSINQLQTKMTQLSQTFNELTSQYNAVNKDLRSARQQKQSLEMTIAKQTEDRKSRFMFVNDLEKDRAELRGKEETLRQKILQSWKAGAEPTQEQIVENQKLYEQIQDMRMKIDDMDWEMKQSRDASLGIDVNQLMAANVEHNEEIDINQLMAEGTGQEEEIDINELIENADFAQILDQSEQTQDMDEPSIDIERS
jgi:chromosome segregation ATPase